jgi:hypothetical protein
LTIGERVANPPRQTSAKKHGTVPADPRYELVFERRFWESVFAELKSLGERSSSALGDAYALAATSFLNRSERLEDLNAERKFHQRSKARASVHAPASDLTSQPQKSSLTK